MSRKPLSLPLVEWVALVDIELAVKNAVSPLPANFTQPDRHFKDGGYVNSCDAIYFFKLADERNSAWHGHYSEIEFRVKHGSIFAVNENNSPIKTLMGTRSGVAYLKRTQISSYLSEYGFSVDEMAKPQISLGGEPWLNVTEFAKLIATTLSPYETFSDPSHLEHCNALEQHFLALRDGVRTGRIAAISPVNAPVNYVSSDTRISKQTAIYYLAICGIEVADAAIKPTTLNTEATKSSDVSTTRSAAQRRAERYQMIIDEGLIPPKDTYAHMPRGIGKIAKKLGITTQSFSEDVKKHIERLGSQIK